MSATAIPRIGNLGGRDCAIHIYGPVRSASTLSDCARINLLFHAELLSICQEQLFALRHHIRDVIALKFAVGHCNLPIRSDVWQVYQSLATKKAGPKRITLCPYHQDRVFQNVPTDVLDLVLRPLLHFYLAGMQVLQQTNR